MSDKIKINGVELKPTQVDLLRLTKDHKFTLAYGSSRGGKSYLFMLLIIMRCLMFPGSRHAVIRQTQDSIDSTIWPTVLEVIDNIDPHYRSKLNITLKPRRIEFDNGSSIWFLGAQDEDAVFKIMGAEYATIFLNEVVHFSHKTYARILTRLNSKSVSEKGERISLKLYADCNPDTTSHWVHQQWIDKLVPGSKKPLFNPEQFASLEFDRNSNDTVDPSYYDELQNLSHEEQMMYLHGKWREQIEGALFSRKDLEDNRSSTPDEAEFDSIMIGVDPAMTNTPKSDETGIIVMGSIHSELPDGGVRKDLYPLADISGRYHPHEWANIVGKAYERWNADAVIVEVNQAGDQNVLTLQTSGIRMNILTVRPGKGMGKNIRAMPIASEMKAGRIHHPMSDTFQELEAQLLQMTGDYDRKSGKSPDRLDAYVYVAAELAQGDDGPSPVVSSKVVGFWGR